MSDDSRNSESLDAESLDDFNFDSFDLDEPQANTGDDAFDLENPFGDGLAAPGSVASAGESPESSADDAFDLENPFGDDLAAPGGETSAGESSESSADDAFDLGGSFGGDDSAAPEEGVSADNPYLSGLTSESSDGEGKAKKGFLGGLFGGKGKSKKEKKKKVNLGEEEKSEGSEGEEDAGEEPKKGKRKKKEKVVKEKKPAGERTPLDLGTMLCIAFAAFWLVSLLMFNIAGLLSREPESSLMQTLCFMGAINLVGLIPACVPILFYKFPAERTLLNVMLGISVVALFTGVMMTMTDFYRYGFALGL